MAILLQWTRVLCWDGWTNLHRLSSYFETLFLFCFGHQLRHWYEVVVHQTFDAFECGITTVGHHQRLWSFIHFNDNHFFSDTVGISDFPTATRCSFGPSIWDCHDAVCCIDCTDVFFEYQSSPFLVGIIPSIFYGMFDWSIDFVLVVSESFEYLIPIVSLLVWQRWC